MFNDFLEHIGIENPAILKRYSDVEIQFVKVLNDGEVYEYHLLTDRILRRDKLEEIRRLMLKKLHGVQKDIRIVQHIKGMEKKSRKDVMKKYWDSIFFEMRRATPSIIAYKDSIEHIFIDDRLKIKLDDEFLFNRLKEKNVDRKISELIKDELGYDDVPVIFELAKENKNIEEIEEIIERQQNETDRIVEMLDIDYSSAKSPDEEEGYVVEFEKDKDIIYGDNINGIQKNICDIDDLARTVLVRGKVFDTDMVELKNGKILYTMLVSDSTCGLTCKVFLKDTDKDDVMNSTKKGSEIKVKGDIVRDHFSGEMYMNVTCIKKCESEERSDSYPEKRVELHAHTQMSAMDAIVPVKDLVKRAAKWGHKAIAITDHGVVQGFPDAMNVSKDLDIKIIYGVEAYLVDDSRDIIENANDRGLDQSFVVFDIETTGFSPINDNITEIGAVRIENGEIVSNFSEFVNPLMDIPYKIQELTGITNEMVEDAGTIDEILPKFLEFAKDSVLVAHNADFDTGFISAKCRKLGIEYDFEKIDTLTLARIILKDMKKFSLDKITKAMGVTLRGHHRAVNDAQATAEVFIKFLDRFRKKGVEKLSDVNRLYGKVDFEKIRPTHATIYARNYKGLRNLYELISDSHINHFYKRPCILKSILQEKREGLIIGTACSSGEIYNAVMRGLPDEEVEKKLEIYDFIEIMPIENNLYMIENGEVKDREELRKINRKLVSLGKKTGIPVVATGDVHMMEPEDDIYRTVLKYSQGYSAGDRESGLYFRTTEEMMEEFSYLGEDTAHEVVIENSNMIADMTEDILPIPKETFPPIIEGSDEELRKMCYEKAHRIYGDPLPEIVKSRLDRELNSIIGNGYAVMYIIANKLVAKSLSDGYLVGSRGSVGSSFAATMSDITEVNPLPAHYICPNEDCKYSYFYKIGEWGSGIDLPDKNCPKCGTKLIKDGHDIPFEVFLGFEGDKEPDIDLNFSGNYQPVIHKYTEELFGEGYTYRAGTIGTVKDKTAYGYVKKYSEENDLDLTKAEMARLTIGCTGVKKTSGQHPGGVMVIPRNKDVHDFTPIQYPANDKTSGVKTTHFDYHSISGRILKLDILGHDGPTIIRMLEDMTGIKITDIPLDDPETMSLFTSTEALGVTPDEIGTTVGSLAIPEFGTKFTRQMLLDTKPTTFAELVRISGLSHGTDVWVNNAQDLVRAGIVGLKDVISTRDDIMNYLIFKGLKPKLAFTIMESVRKGRGLKPEFEEAMIENNVPDWYIGSCKKIKYMFPKAHAVAYVMTSFRIAYCKVNYPEAFYATYFTTKVEDFDIELVTKGIDAVRERMQEIDMLGTKATQKEKNQYTILEVVVEMFARGIEFLKVDIYNSSAREFQIAGKGKILPPMISLQGMGENAAESIVMEREKGEFISKEDLIKRTKISKTVVEKLSAHGSLENMSEKNQLSLF